MRSPEPVPAAAAGRMARRAAAAPPRRGRRALALTLGAMLAVAATPAAAAVPYRVIGGSPVAAIASFPFQVALYIQGPAGLLNPTGRSPSAAG